MGYTMMFDEEHDALYFADNDQMTIDRDIYFFIKRFINRETGKAGDKTYLSWNFIVKHLISYSRSGYAGNALAKVKNPEDYVKKCVKRMEKKGWLTKVSSKSRLVIFFNLFYDCYQHYFIEKKDSPFVPPLTAPLEDDDKPHNSKGCSDFSADAAPQDSPQDSAQDSPIPDLSISLPLTNNSNIIEDNSNDHANVDVDYLQYEKFMQEEATQVTPDTPPANPITANDFMNHDHQINVTTPERAKTPFNDKQDGLVCFFVGELKMSIRAVNNPDSLQHFKTWREQYSDDVIKRMVREAKSMVNHKISVPKYFNYLFTTEQTNNSNLNNTQTNNMGYYDEASQQYIEQSNQQPTANRQPNRYQRKPDWQELYESATGTSVIW